MSHTFTPTRDARRVHNEMLVFYAKRLIKRLRKLSDATPWTDFQQRWTINNLLENTEWFAHSASNIAASFAPSAKVMFAEATCLDDCVDAADRARWECDEYDEIVEYTADQTEGMPADVLRQVYMELAERYRMPAPTGDMNVGYAKRNLGYILAVEEWQEYRLYAPFDGAVPDYVECPVHCAAYDGWKQRQVPSSWEDVPYEWEDSPSHSPYRPRFGLYGIGTRATRLGLTLTHHGERAVRKTGKRRLEM